MYGAIIIGTVAGMAAYVATGGENYAMMLVITIFSALFGVVVADRLLH